MKTAELRQKSKEELQSLLEAARAELDGLRFRMRQRKEKNVKEAKEKKKDIARILTLLRAYRK